MNKATYEKMSPNQKAVIDAHCSTDWVVKVVSPWADYESSGYEMFKNTADTVLTSLTPEQTELWRKAAEPLYEEWNAAVRRRGGNPDEIMKSLKASQQKYGAAN
jgi:TRAP-type C4-dicarboxylate transport system substrate-binding protein